MMFMKRSASVKNDFEYACGEVFPLEINDNVTGEFIITKRYAVKNIYILENTDENPDVESVVVDRQSFENRVRKAHRQGNPFVKLKIYDYDSVQSIKYRNENSKDLTK